MRDSELERFIRLLEFEFENRFPTGDSSWGRLQLLRAFAESVNLARDYYKHNEDVIQPLRLGPDPNRRVHVPGGYYEWLGRVERGMEDPTAISERQPQRYRKWLRDQAAND